MQRTLRTRLGLLAIVLALVLPSAAQAEIGGDSVLLRQVEDYFNGFSTMTARFTQYNQDGTRAEGTLWMKRPGRFRLEYGPPNDILLVGDGTWLIFYDAALDQVSHLPLRSGAPRFLTEPAVRFGGDVMVTGVERDDGLIRIGVTDRDEPAAGRLTLVLSEDPIELRRWTMVDATGSVVTIVLRDIQYGVPLNNRFFYFTDNSRVKDFRRGSYD